MHALVFSKVTIGDYGLSYPIRNATH